MVIRNGIITVATTEEIRSEAMEIATARNKNKKQDNKFTERYTSLEIQYWGVLCELMWEKITGWKMDRRILRHGDGGADFKVGDVTYQMKTCNKQSYRYPDLLCRLDYAKADKFILSEVDSEDLSAVTFVGWCTREELTSTIRPIKGKGDRYVRNRSDLRKIPREVLI